ncbi:hypothetical protein HDU67_001810, partial [Dinochytrium kinnereticum]
MFSQSKRFVETALPDTPGPNAYDVKSTSLEDDAAQKGRRLYGVASPTRGRRRLRRVNIVAGDDRGEEISVVDDDKLSAERWQDQCEKALYTHERTILVLEERITRLDSLALYTHERTILVLGERITRLDSLLQSSIKDKNSFA